MNFGKYWMLSLLFALFGPSLNTLAEDDLGLNPEEFNPQIIDTLSDIALVLVKKDLKNHPRCFYKLNIVKKNKKQTLISTFDLGRDFCFDSELKSFVELDVNFDGHEDIRIVASQNKNKGHDLFFIRNIKSKKFELSNELFKLANVDLLEDRKIVRGAIRCGAECFELKAFQWVEGKLVQMKKAPKK